MPELLETIREAALEKKAEDFIEIDISGKSIIADTFVILTGRSKIQTRSIAEGITGALKRSGSCVARIEGYNDGNWILLDCGSVVVHVFTPEQRAFYNLERLWVDAAQRQVAL